jgi:hypothetical protein
MRSRPVTRQGGGILLVVLLLTGAGLSGGLAPLGARPEVAASPVEQVVEYGVPPFGLTVLRGTFDPAELRAAWARGGYQRNALGAGEAYAVREDFAIDMSHPGSRMAFGYLNVVAIADDGTLIFGKAHDGVRGALVAAAGTEPSFAERTELFSGRSVRALSAEPAVLIELLPAAGVRPFILQDMVLRRISGFLARDW